jgi:hypothetical protein
MMTGALNQSTATAPTTGGNDPFVALEKLAELLKRGIITQADFDAKKTELLQQIK